MPGTPEGAAAGGEVTQLPKVILVSYCVFLCHLCHAIIESLLCDCRCPRWQLPPLQVGASHG